jgi:hypothetical protein
MFFKIQMLKSSKVQEFGWQIAVGSWQRKLVVSNEQMFFKIQMLKSSRVQRFNGFLGTGKRDGKSNS